MESFEFLGGRYNRPEQIMSGPVQAFRAQNAASGRTVFIHRVSTTEAPDEQAGLLKLLTSALVKSADTKRLVLDFGEERGFWYVVTESEPQCALLREWLQLEIDAAAANSRLGLPRNSSPDPASAPTVTKVTPPAARADSGEFTRFLQTRTPLTTPPSTVSNPLPQAPPSPKPPVAPPPEPFIGEFTRMFNSTEQNQPPSKPVTPPQAPSPQAPAPPPVTRPAVGEFTSFFNPSAHEIQPSQTPPQEQVQSPATQSPVTQRPMAPPPPPSSPAPPTQPAEGGEFTRFFKGGLPPSPPKPAAGAPPPINFSERSQNNPFVQRPHTPVPPPLVPPATKTPETGEFTRLFSATPRSSSAQRPANVNFQPTTGFGPGPGFAAPGGGSLRDEPRPQEDRSADMFSDRIDIPQPLPSSQPSQSEFTRMFGGGGSAPPPLRPPAVVAPPPNKSLVDDGPLNSTQQFKPPAPPTSANPPADSPSEFTRIMRGGSSQTPAAPPPPEAHAAPFAMPQIPLPKPALPRPPALPKVALPALPAAGKNKKLAVFFSILGALALLLIALMTFLMKK